MSDRFPEGGPELTERYHRLVELAPDGILIHYGECIVMANAAAARLAGAAHPDELVGQSIETFLSPPYLKSLEAWLVGGDKQGPFTTAVRDTFRRLDGGEVAVDVTAIPFVEAGRPAAHLVIRDITDRLAASALRAEAQKSVAVRTLAGGVAHEVNNMMMVILGFSEFLAEDGSLPVATRGDAREIQRAADRAAVVARQLLDFSRPEVHAPQVLALDAVVEDLRAMIERRLGDGRRLITTLACPGRVLLDAHHFEQIVSNLVLNARDAMPTGGTLTLRTRATDLGQGQQHGVGGVTIPAGRYGVLSVADSGVGMDADTMARSFEPFFTTKPVGHGTGLGLSVLQGQMDRNGAYVTVASVPGEGTMFMLYFPLLPDGAAAELPVGHPLDRPVGTLTGVSVLIVDDEPSVRMIAARQLKDSGCHVLQASDGAAALELVDRNGPPDLVLSDVMMPGMGGAELARRLRARWPRLPIVFMSGHAEDYLQRAGRLEHGEYILKKPFRAAMLIRSVDEALQVRAT